MPVYLFTFHTYRSWMPDHKRGYTRRGKGYQRPDAKMARRYEDRAARDEEVLLDSELRALIDELQVAARRQRLQLHAASTEPTHIHALVSWKTVRGWMRVRMSLKTSLTKRLNEISRKRDSGSFLALSRGASRKHVKTRDHFDYLMNVYLVKHRGCKWFEDRKWMK